MSVKPINFTGNFVIDLMLNAGLLALIGLVFVSPLYLWLGSCHVTFNIFDIYMDTSIAKTYLKYSILTFLILICGFGFHVFWKDKSYRREAIAIFFITCILIYFSFGNIIKLFYNVSQLKNSNTIVYTAEIKGITHKSGSKTKTKYDVQYWESSGNTKHIGIMEKIKKGNYNLIAINESSGIVFQNKNSISEATYEYCKGGVSMAEQKRLEYLDKYKDEFSFPRTFEASDLTEKAECRVIERETCNLYKPLRNVVLIWYDKRQSLLGKKYDRVRLKYDKKNTYKYQIVDIRRKSDGKWIKFEQRDIAEEEQQIPEEDIHISE